MSSKEVQYINLIKVEQNIKFDHQVFTNGKLLTAEQSVFLLDNEKLSDDALFKIKVLEKEIPNSFITAICEDSNQQIVDKTNPKLKNSVELTFDASHTIVLPKTNIEYAKSFYNNGNIDYFISPFTILYEETLLQAKENSLNLFILNNHLYAIVLNEKKRLGYSCIKFLTPYCDIKKSNFYKDEVVEQILYDEIYLLELSEHITEILKIYSEISNTSLDCKNVNIFYILKQLQDKHIEALQNALSLEISYLPINIDDAVDAIARRESIQNYSFTKKREKKSKYTIFIWIFIALVTTVGAVYSFYFLQSSATQTNDLNSTKENTTKQISEIDLPHHIEHNKQIITLITTIFDSIDDNSLLKEIQVAKNESTIIYEFKAINPFEEALKPKLLELYETSENILTTEKKGTFTSIISNVNLLKKLATPTKKYIPTAKERFLTSKEATLGIEQLFKKENTTVKLQSETTEKYVKYQFEVSTIFTTPVEFFTIIALLEKQNYSIILDYPIEFAKTNNGLETKFALIISQNKPQSLQK